MSASNSFVAKLDGLQYCSSQWGCSLSMSVLAKLLATPGWLEGHATKLQQAMRDRCLALLAAAEQHLTGLATWRAPQAGMFLWVELANERAPAALLAAMVRLR